MRIAQFTFNAFSENTYVLSDDAGEAIIIDPGMTDIQEDAILFEYIAEENLIPRLILNTHCHLDHILGNSAAQDYMVPVRTKEVQTTRVKGNRSLGDRGEVA